MSIRVSRVKILYCIDSIGHKAGSEIQLAEIIRRIDRERFDVHLFCLEDSAVMRRLAGNARVLVLPVHKVLSPNGFQQIGRLRRYIREEAIDIVHTWMIDAMIVGILASIGSGCPVVLSSRRNLGYAFRPKNLLLYPFLNRFTTRILANSEAVKQVVVHRERMASDRIDVLYNGVDTERFAPRPSRSVLPGPSAVPTDVPVVGVVANLRPVKDHDTFLRAARIVADSIPEAAFLIVGTGPLRDRIAALVESLGLGDRVHFSDGKGDVIDYLQLMDVGCLTSLSEGFSNSILEYMAMGIPVVATDVGGNREAIVHGETGYLVPKGDATALAEHVIALLSDPAMRKRMSRAARRRCEAEFSMETAVLRHEEYYLELAGGPAAITHGGSPS